MAAELQLGADQPVPGKPFVDPEQTAVDEQALRRLLGHLRDRAAIWDGEERDVVLRETDGEGLRHLLVVPDTRTLLDARDPTIVGFFGRARADADADALFALEEELVEGMHAYAAQGLLSYYDVELAKDSYGNLILFTGPEGPENWRDNPVHDRAVTISPANYEHIRLHQGRLDGSLLGDGTLRIERTRYLDYTEDPVWRAVRPRA